MRNSDVFTGEKMKAQTLRSNLFMFLAAAIWGLAFVAQRVGAEHMGPYTFNGIRFGLGSLSLIPLILFFGYKSRNNSDTQRSFRRTLPAGLIVGCVLFIAASVQQIGMAETSAGKAAFITGLYIVLVPVLGIFLKHVIRINTWLGVVLAALGLYFLCVTGDFTISGADLLELIASFFWAVHILLIDHFVKKFDALKLCFLQFVTCSILSTIVALIFERITIDSLMQTLIPLLYGGICSVGIAYTLQVLGQKHAQPSHAAIILSLETVFASIGGAILLGENMGARGYFGCALMMAGMLLSQLQNFRMSSNKENRSLSSTS